MRVCAQRTIQELFEVCVPLEEPVFPVTAEEFVVLPQEPTVTETIAPKIARPFIEVRTEPARVLGEEPPLFSNSGGAPAWSLPGPGCAGASAGKHPTPASLVRRFTATLSIF